MSGGVVTHKKRTLLAFPFDPAPPVTLIFFWIAYNHYTIHQKCLAFQNTIRRLKYFCRYLEKSTNGWS